jgi:hypothetical protein
VWQSLVESLADQPFTVLAVALDDAEAARPWIEAARPTYPCLIDRHHHLAGLYGLVNVPQAQMAEATRLHPDSWAMWRQAAAKDGRGLASGPEFWARVDALGERPYYPPAHLGPAGAQPLPR